MANQNIVKYLLEGRRRGFSIELLKKKLVEGGFAEYDINEAIAEVNKQFGIEAPSESNKATTLKIKEGERPINRFSSQERWGIFTKIGKSIASPVALFENTRNEGMGGALNFWLVLSLFPIMTISTIIGLGLGIGLDKVVEIVEIIKEEIVTRGFNVPQEVWTYLDSGTLIATLVFVVLFLIIFYLFLPIAGLLCSIILHLLVKLYGGVGTYADTYRALFYSAGPILLFWFFLPLTILWSFILSIFGLAINHGISKARAFFAFVSFGLLAAIIWFSLELLSQQGFFDFASNFFIGLI